MPIARNRRNQLSYKRFAKNNDKATCDFCNFTKNHDQIIKELRYFWIARNIFPYDVWDTTGVNDHLLLVPKRHVDSVGHFNIREQAEYAKIIGEYDLRGYSIYARARSNIIKSIPHQHSHLIAISNKPKKALFYLNRPYILWHK